MPSKIINPFSETIAGMQASSSKLAQKKPHSHTRVEKIETIHSAFVNADALRGPSEWFLEDIGNYSKGLLELFKHRRSLISGPRVLCHCARINLAPRISWHIQKVLLDMEENGFLTKSRSRTSNMYRYSITPEGIALVVGVLEVDKSYFEVSKGEVR